MPSARTTDGRIGLGQPQQARQQRDAADGAPLPPVEYEIGQTDQDKQRPAQVKCSRYADEADDHVTRQGRAHHAADGRQGVEDTDRAPQTGQFACRDPDHIRRHAAEQKQGRSEQQGRTSQGAAAQSQRH